MVTAIWGSSLDSGSGRPDTSFWQGGRQFIARKVVFQTNKQTITYQLYLEMENLKKTMR